jgi:ABC-type spermidine/putrescine transport system permease subunit I
MSSVRAIGLEEVRPATKAPRREPRRRSFAPRRASNWVPLVLPLAWLTALFLYPIVRMLAQSFTGPLGFENYTAIFTSPADLKVIWVTVQISLIVCVISVLIGYPTAYFLTTQPPRRKLILTLLLTAPFWVSILVRSFAWIVILGSDGFIQRLCGALGFKVPRLLYTEFAVVIAMVQILLPLAILVFRTTMDQLDPTLIPAARTLGASAGQALLHVYLPLTRRIIATALLLIFVLSLGYYITPALVGGPGQTMVGELLADQVNATFQWGIAEALSTLLLVSSVIIFVIVNKAAGGVRGIMSHESN